MHASIREPQYATFYLARIPMTSDLSLSIFTIVILILSVIMHEVAHGYAAYMLGDPTAKLKGRLTVNPLAHIDPFGSILVPAVLVLTNAGVLFGWAKPVPYNPYNLKNQRWGEAIVGVAGVGTNILLALIFTAVTRVANMEGLVLFATLAAEVVLVNLSLGLFNLIPVPPLDGYTVLRGILPIRFSLAFRDFEQRMYGNNIIFRFVLLFVFVYFLATPFFSVIEWIFHILVGM
jgi:Zn-dependent protease